MTLTYGQLSQEVQHSLGGRPSTVGTQTVTDRTREIVNQAGMILFSMPWRFRERVDTFNIVANQPYVTLPLEALAVRAAWWDGIGVVLCTPEQVEQARSSTTFGMARIGCARMSVSASVYSLRMELFPTPTSASTDGLKVMYQAGWTQFTSSVSDDDVVPVPEYAEMLLRQYVRAVAESYEDGSLAERTQAILAGPAYASCKLQDEMLQVSFGPLPQQPFGVPAMFRVTSVADPS